jgi:uncharacterized protein with PIN domain
MMEECEMRFLADSMLGKLAKWLRVMGYDTHYQPFYQKGVIDNLIRNRRILLTRNTSTIGSNLNSFLVLPDNVREQLNQIRASGYIHINRSQWFSRCLICNVKLKKVPIKESLATIPEYVLYQNNPMVSYCPSCQRNFWPGSHRLRMIDQLKEWEFSDE